MGKNNPNKACLIVSLDKAEKQSIVDAAKSYGITISDYMRGKLFSGREIKTNSLERFVYEEKIKTLTEQVEELKENLQTAKG